MANRFFFFIPVFFQRLRKDTPKQFFSRIGIFALLLYPGIKKRFAISQLRKSKPSLRFFEREINGSRMLLDIEDPGIATDLLYAGIREPLSTKFIQKFVKEGNICVDIGANIGYYALLEARIVGDRGRVYAIEPVEENVEMLEKNIELNNYVNIEIVPVAIGGENRTGMLFLSEYSNWHSLTDAPFPAGKTRPVRVLTLDTFLEGKPYPDFIRMDVEGYETEVIRGMEQLLSVKKPLKIFIELHSFLLEDGGAALLQTLRRAGFTIRAIFHEPRALILGEGKILRGPFDSLLSMIGMFRNRYESYDVSIGEFLEALPHLRRNACEIFLERS